MKNEKSVKKAQIIHNLMAGNAEHKKDDLIAKVEDVAGEVHYLSTDNPRWSDFTENSPDVIFLGGGDGTVHKLAEVLLRDNTMKQRTPVCLLPLGTANNIAKTLEIPKGMESISQKSFNQYERFDIGRIRISGKEHFFLEAAGFGIFPRLVSEMDKKDDDSDTAAEELERSMETLLQVITDYKAQPADILADDKHISGSFLLVELMNIKYIGPNFEIAPEADISDGHLDLVLVRKENRFQLLEYVKALVENKKSNNEFSAFAESYKVKNVRMSWGGKDIHVDDEPVPNYKGENLQAEVEPDALRFVESS